MNAFLQTCLTFPTLPYSMVLAFCVIYWALAATGLIDIDGFEGIALGDSDIDVNTGPGMLARLGLGGVPVMLVMLLVSFFGWMATYFVHLLVLRHVPDSLRLLAGIGVLIAALVPGVVISSLLLRPLRRLIVKLRPPIPPSLLGRTAIVTTPEVDDRDGMASMDNGGAGLILQVRARAPDRFKRGDAVVLIEFDSQQHAYRVIPEERFRQA